MHEADARKQRVEALLTLACEARGWTRAKLAEALDRDVSRLSPDSGDPKLGFVMKLAEVLQWPIGEVAQAIWGDRRHIQPSMPVQGDYDTLRRESYAAFKKADHHRALDLARSMEALARTEDEAAHACANIAGFLNLLGRHVEASEVASRALAMSGLDTGRRVHLQVNLVLALLKLRRLHLAASLSTLVDTTAAELLPGTPRFYHSRAFARYARGYCHLQLAFVELDSRRSHLSRAIDDFKAATEFFEQGAESLDLPELNGMSIACEAWSLECRVELGEISATEGIAAVSSALDQCVDLKDCGAFELEGCAWMALAGASIAIRHLSGAELHRTLAVFVGKALDISGFIDHWYIQERACTLQYLGHRAIVQETGVDVAMVIDSEDRARISNLMAKFPHFRDTGWRILDSARYVRD